MSSIDFHFYGTAVQLIDCEIVPSSPAPLTGSGWSSATLASTWRLGQLLALPVKSAAREKEVLPGLDFLPGSLGGD